MTIRLPQIERRILTENFGAACGRSLTAFLPFRSSTKIVRQCLAFMLRVRCPRSARDEKEHYELNQYQR
jgi:hypothetical protein